MKTVLSKLAHATPETAPEVPGRRAFFKYRDLLVHDATDGQMRAQMPMPGGLKHNEIATSEVFEWLEVTTPGAMGTVPCDKPAHLS